MLDLRPVLQIVGRILCLLAAAMLVPAVADMTAGNREWATFAVAAGLTLFVGLALEFGMRAVGWRELSLRQAHLATALGWMAPCALAALPFAFGAPHLSATDSLFEATCGVTATSASLLPGLDRLPPGLLLWRALLQWLGGIGGVVTALAVLPGLRVGGMQIFRIEMLAPADRTAPRAARIGAILLAVYGGLTLLIGLCLWLAGMPRFDAWLHAMATISTGGFSTWTGSLGHFANARVDLVVAIGMVLGGMPFMLYFHLAEGNWRAALRETQLRWYLGVLLGATAALTLWLMVARHFDPATALRQGGFTLASVMTGTGFVSADYTGWGGMPAALLLFVSLLGGCAGSTTGGVKIFRLQLLLADAMVQMRQMLRPHAVLITTFNRRPVSKEVLESVMGFLFVYAIAVAALAMGLGLLGVDFVSALSGAAAAIANLGPGLGAAIGPTGGFAHLPDPAKWLLMAGMVFGRLEMFPLLVLFAPSFWKQ